MFPLAAVTREAVAVGGQASGNCRPFGLRYLVDPDLGAADDLDLASVRFDDAAQIVVMSDEFGGIPMFRHTSSRTSTTTNVQDRRASDSDTDYEQDR